MNGRPLRALGALLIPAGLALFLFRGVLFLGELPFKRDMGRLFVPLKHALSESLRAGTLPQWWPWDALGMPFVAVPLLSTFHPSTLLFWVLPFQGAFVLQLLLPVPLALVGTWRLGRALGLRPVFAAMAATGYVFAGYFLCLTEFTFTSLAAGALPWLWWGALRCRRQGRLRPGVLALALASMLLAGDPQLSIMGLLAAAVLVPRLGPVRRLGRPVLAFALGTGLAVALSAVQLLPTLFLFRESPRSSLQPLVGADHWRLTAPELLGMVSPGAFPGGFSLFETTYLGLGVAALALAGAATRGRTRGPLVGIAVVALVLALGAATPLWSVFSAGVPFWKSFRYPIKAIGPAMLVLPLLAARGAQGILAPGPRRFLPATVCALAAVAESLTGVWGPALLCLLLAVLLAVAAGRRTLRPVLSHVALALVAVDLGLANGFVMETVTADFYEAPPLVERLRQGGISAQEGCYLFQWQPSPRLDGIVSMDVAHNAALAPLRGALHGLPTCDAYLVGYSARYDELAKGEGTQRWVEGLAGVYGARQLLTSTTAIKPEQRARVLTTDDFSESVVLTLPRYLPRAYTVQGVKVLPRAQVVDYLRSDFRPGQEVVLEAEAAGPELAREPQGPARGVERIRRLGDAVEVEATLPAPGMLVLNESFFEGVQATEEGRRLPVYPANHAVRAVPLAAGRHVVRFEYHTPGLVAGALTSTAAGVLLTAAGVLQAWRRRKKGSGLGWRRAARPFHAR